MLLVIALVCFFVPFAALASMRRWQTLLPVAALAAVLCVWGWSDYYVARQDVSEFDYSVRFITFAVFGAIFGFLARATYLVWQTVFKRTPAFWPFIIIFSVLPIIPSIFNELVREYERRPPSAACLSTDYIVDLQGRPMRLPLAPNLAISAPERDPSYFRFQWNFQARDFCQQARKEAGIKVESIAIEMAYFSVGPVKETAFCRHPQSIDWARDVCTRPIDDLVEIYPLSIVFDVGDSFSFPFQSALAKQLLEQDNDKPAPPRTRIDGDVYGYSQKDGIGLNYYLLVDSAPLDLATCFQPDTRSEDRELSCTLRTAFEEGVATYIEFGALPEDFQTRAVQMKKITRVVLQDMRSP